ncbi:hypothetical protein OROHE_014401 [Orobanche hederae]
MKGALFRSAIRRSTRSFVATSRDFWSRGFPSCMLVCFLPFQLLACIRSWFRFSHPHTFCPLQQFFILFFSIVQGYAAREFAQHVAKLGEVALIFKEAVVPSEHPALGYLVGNLAQKLSKQILLQRPLPVQLGKQTYKYQPLMIGTGRSTFRNLKDLCLREVLDLGYNRLSGQLPCDLQNNFSMTIILTDNSGLLHTTCSEMYVLQKSSSQVQVEEEILPGTDRALSYYSILMSRQLRSMPEHSRRCLQPNSKAVFDQKSRQHAAYSKAAYSKRYPI